MFDERMSFIRAEGLHPPGARTRSAGHAAEGKRGCPHSRSRATSPNEFSLHAAVLSPHTIPSVLTLFNTSENPRPPPLAPNTHPGGISCSALNPRPGSLLRPAASSFGVGLLGESVSRVARGRPHPLGTAVLSTRRQRRRRCLFRPPPPTHAPLPLPLPHTHHSHSHATPSPHPSSVQIQLL